MKNISFYRIGLLFKRYFCENWKRDVIVAAIIFGVEMLTSICQGPSDISWFLLFIFFIIYSGRIFGMLGKPQKAINYLMLPASNGEKLTVNIILSHLYYPILLIAASCLGILASSFFCYFIYGEFALKTISWFSLSGSILFILSLLLTNAVMMFGSVYFRKRAVILTLLCTMAYIIVFSAVIISVVLLYLRCMGLPSFVEAPEYMGNIGVVKYIVMGCMIAFFWVLSFFRLRETEA